MTTDVHTPILRMVWPATMSEINLEPLQGLWTETQYLILSDQTNHLIEFTDGVVEVLPMPTRKHQSILALLYELVVAFIRPRGGKVLFAPLRLRIREGKYREPDLLVLRDANDPHNQDRYWLGADLVVEVVSPDDLDRDTVTKRTDYAEADIPEYWIVNPLDETITVLMLAGDAYVEHGRFPRGETATSRLLEGFTVSVDVVFDAE
ncbi:MAG: Uma2 family endonuclease [Chloroflexales bacterium]|nr:Uma2 family endonuclease [Chloroflexales bacterium]